MHGRMDWGALRVRSGPGPEIWTRCLVWWPRNSEWGELADLASGEAQRQVRGHAQGKRR